MAVRRVNLSIGTLPHVIGRRLRLTEMFKHLITNAIKFGKKDTPVQINISSQEFLDTDGSRYVMISVSDNGIGFDQKYGEKIFDLFQKLHNLDEYPGSGIGLSLCKKVVEEHNGWISAVSQPQIGSTFNVFIPAAQ